MQQQHPKTVFVIRLEVLPASVPAANRLRMFLKRALRSWGFRALSVREEVAAQ